MEKDANSQLYGSFFGQEDPLPNASPETFGDHVDGGTSRFDQNGVIYEVFPDGWRLLVKKIDPPTLVTVGSKFVIE